MDKIYVHSGLDDCIWFGPFPTGDRATAFCKKHHILSYPYFSDPPQGYVNYSIPHNQKEVDILIEKYKKLLDRKE